MAYYYILFIFVTVLGFGYWILEYDGYAERSDKIKHFIRLGYSMGVGWSLILILNVMTLLPLDVPSFATIPLIIAFFVLPPITYIGFLLHLYNKYE